MILAHKGIPGLAHKRTCRQEGRHACTHTQCCHLSTTALPSIQGFWSTDPPPQECLAVPSKLVGGGDLAQPYMQPWPSLCLLLQRSQCQVGLSPALPCPAPCWVTLSPSPPCPALPWEGMAAELTRLALRTQCWASPILSTNTGSCQARRRRAGEAPLAASDVGSSA